MKVSWQSIFFFELSFHFFVVYFIMYHFRRVGIVYRIPNSCYDFLNEGPFTSWETSVVTQVCPQVKREINIP